MNTFDALIVLSDVVALVLSSFLDDDWGSQFLSLLRGMRMLRLIRVIRNAVAFRELFLMLMGLVTALRAIAFGHTFSPVHYECDPENEIMVSYRRS